MSEEIINVLNYLGEQLGIGIDWSAENVWPQVMDILGRYRLLEIISTCMWIFAETVFVVVSLIAIVKCIKASARIRKTKEDNFWWYRGYSSTWMSGAGTIITILSVVIGGSFLFMLPMDIGKLLKWIIVPEIQYLEMLKGLMA
jgi:hypothetical protein